MILAGSFQRAWTGVASNLEQSYLILASMGVVGVVLGAWYMLWAVERVFFGASRLPPSQQSATDAEDSLDIRWHELAALAPLAFFALWIGLAPNTFLGPPAQTVRQLTLPASTAFAEQMRPSRHQLDTSHTVISIPQRDPQSTAAVAILHHPAPITAPITD
jgi:NADH:ubiquinone oxidoreductase subunit 4 (subunit M)